jgi:hypothetical protein
MVAAVALERARLGGVKKLLVLAILVGIGVFVAQKVRSS